MHFAKRRRGGGARGGVRPPGHPVHIGPERLMNRVRAPLLLLCALSAAPAPRASAQSPGGVSLALELTPTVAVPAGQFSSTTPGAGAGVGVGGGALLGLGSRVGLYGAYQYLRFGCSRCAGAGLDGVADLGWEAGAQLAAPLTVGGLRPWLRGGLLAHQLRFSGTGASEASQRAIGFSVGVGSTIPLGPTALLPAVRFRAYPAEFEFASLPRRATEVMYLSVDLGLAFGL
jgi:hypothetical protein